MVHSISRPTYTMDQESIKCETNCDCGKEHTEYQPKVNLIEFLTDKDRILNKVCEKVTEITPEIDNFIEDMRATMHYYRGIAIAAPQVGKSLQIIVINAVVFNNTEDIVLINPELDILSGVKEMDMEFCLSFPTGKYKSRYVECQIKCLNREMKNAVVFSESAIQARILQHEYDHLLGKTIISD